MDKETLRKAQTIDDTEQTLSSWLLEEEKKEDNPRGLFVSSDFEYLKKVRQEIKAATVRILKKHIAIKKKELEEIK